MYIWLIFDIQNVLFYRHVVVVYVLILFLLLGIVYAKINEISSFWT